MKAIQLKQAIYALMALVMLNSCVQDDDFKTPNITITEPVLDGDVITIDALFGILEQAIADGDIAFTFEDSDSYVEGYVVSNDEAGNFFEEIIIQDKLENPTRGVKVLLDESPLFPRYELGRKIFVKLDGLSVGYGNGVLSLGLREGDFLEQIPGPQEDEYIIRSAEKGELVPLPIGLDELSLDKTNLFVRLEDVQFRRDQVLIENPLTFAAEPLDEFDGERVLEDCASGSTVTFSTSTFADFKGLELPAQRGSMDAILTLDFFGEDFNIVVNSASDLNFDNPERCDPDLLECTTASGGGSAFYDEDFESFSGYSGEGWTNVNVGGGTVDWIVGSFSGNAYAQISGFNSDEDPIDVWLVTPPIDMDSTTGEELSFDVQTNFNNGNILTVWITTDFTGDPTTTEWTALDALIPEGSSSGFGSFEPVGPINISCLDGEVHVGFFYQGADPGPTTRYHIDNIEVTGN